MSTTPEWHEDPTAPGSGRQRYWDGTQWTEWVMDPGSTESRKYPVAEAQADAAANPPTQQMADPGATAPVGGQPGGKSKAPLIIGIVVGVVLLFIIGGLVLGGLFAAKVTNDVSDQLEDLAASASAELDDWESWAADITEEAEALEDELGDATSDPAVSASLDALFPDDDDPESIYLWLVEIFDTGMDDATALEAGYWVCSEFEAGATDSLDSINQLLIDTADRYALDEWAAAGVVSSATELCPDWSDALEEAWG